MIKKMAKKMNDKVKKLSKKIKPIVLTLAYFVLTRPVPVYAATGSYTAPLDNLKIVLITIAGSLGGILLVYGIIQFALAFQDMDQGGERKALIKVITGGLLAGISVVLAVIGV